jgi:hypothetical protein
MVVWGHHVPPVPFARSLIVSLGIAGERNNTILIIVQRHRPQPILAFVVIIDVLAIKDVHS